MSEPLHCVNHPNVETYLRCNRCGAPICAKCAVRTPVGYRCRDCVNAQQKVFYADFRPVFYAIAAAVGFPLSLVAGWLVPRLGWYAIFLGPLVGVGIAEVVRWAIRRRRGQYTWLVVCGCIVAGWLVKLLLSFALVYLFSRAVPQGGAYLTSFLPSLIWDAVYLATAVGAAYARLRPGRRV